MSETVVFETEAASEEAACKGAASEEFPFRRILFRMTLLTSSLAFP